MYWIKLTEREYLMRHLYLESYFASGQVYAFIVVHKIFQVYLVCLFLYRYCGFIPASICKELTESIHWQIGNPILL